MLPDGRVVLHNNTVHFAPAHPAALTLYDQRSNTLTRLYPPGPDPARFPMIDRRIHSVAWDAARRVVTFSSGEQLVDVNRDNAPVESGPERRYTVTCTVASARPRCDKEEIKSPRR
jgi:hypothetical protein